MDLIIQHFLRIEYRWSIYREFKVFYKKGVHAQNKTEITSVQDRHLEYLIESKSDDDKLMLLLFDLICDFEKDRKLNLYKKYLSVGSDINIFKQLRLFPSSMRGEGGSFVPVIARRKDFVQELSESCNSLKLLQHRAYLEEKISYLRDDIQIYMKRDFTEDNF